MQIGLKDVEILKAQKNAEKAKKAMDEAKELGRKAKSEAKAAERKERKAMSKLDSKDELVQDLKVKVIQLIFLHFCCLAIV